MIFDIFLDGVKYASTWPNNKLLNSVFKEWYIISALNFSKKILPPVVAFFLVWYAVFYLYTNYKYEFYVLPTAVCFIFFSLLIHWYGLFYLGKKSRTKLIGKHLVWYQHICKALGVATEIAPTYMSLAKALKNALSKEGIDKTFMDEL